MRQHQQYPTPIEQNAVVQFIAPSTAAPEQIPGFSALMDTVGIRKVFKPGQVIFLEDQPSDAVYQVVAGTVRCCRITTDGRRQISRFVSTDDEMALTAFKTYDYTAEAITEVVLLRCPRPAFEAALRSDETLRDSVFQRMASELTASRDQMVLLGQLNAAERAATFLLRLAGNSAEPKGELHLPMTRQDIADHLGMTLETVSRMFNKLKRTGVIEMPAPDRIRICDHDQLSTIANAA